MKEPEPSGTELAVDTIHSKDNSSETSAASHNTGVKTQRVQFQTVLFRIWFALLVLN